MELKEYILSEFANLERTTTRATDGLTQQELSWRPASGCNPIGLILFHTAKFEDMIGSGRIMDRAPLWQTEKWYEKLNLPENEMGAHYTIEQVNAFPMPESKRLMEYCLAVRVRTVEYLKNMNAADFDRKVTMPRGGENTIGGVFSFIVAHTMGHLGEMSYLRGIQRGMDK